MWTVRLTAGGPCALLSNGLKNALNATGAQDESRRWAELYCGVRLDKLLIEIRNPYSGGIVFRDGLPVSETKWSQRARCKITGKKSRS